MFRQNDDISWRLRACSGVATGSTAAVPRQRPRISNRSEGANAIDRFPPRHCFESDRREFESVDSERCLAPPRSLRNSPAYVALPYFVGSANFSRTSPRRESLLRRIPRLAAATDNRSQRHRARRPAECWTLRGGRCPCKAVSTIVMGRRRPISTVPGISQCLLQGSTPRQEPVCGSFH